MPLMPDHGNGEADHELIVYSDVNGTGTPNIPTPPLPFPYRPLNTLPFNGPWQTQRLDDTKPLFLQTCHHAQRGTRDIAS
jgi:hypothetical protein